MPPGRPPVQKIISVIRNAFKLPIKWKLLTLKQGWLGWPDARECLKNFNRSTLHFEFCFRTFSLSSSVIPYFIASPTNRKLNYRNCLLIISRYKANNLPCGFYCLPSLFQLCWSCEVECASYHVLTSRFSPRCEPSTAGACLRPINLRGFDVLLRLSSVKISWIYQNVIQSSCNW